MDDLRGGSLQVCRMRVARIEATGEPDVGAGNMVVTDTLINLNTSPEIKEGEIRELLNGCAEISVQSRDDDELRWLNATMSLTKPDPVLIQMLVGGTILLDGAEEVGYAYPPVGPFNQPDVSIEAWSKHIVDGDQDGTNPWIRWVHPKTRWRIADQNLENAVQAQNLVGWIYENPNWGNGPANDWDYASTRVRQYALDPGPLPAAAFGAAAIPADVP